VEETEIIIEVNELYYMLKSSLMKYWFFINVILESMIKFVVNFLLFFSSL
jgi:hypothetical protein